jgi:hypothetical protein
MPPLFWEDFHEVRQSIEQCDLDVDALIRIARNLGSFETSIIHGTIPGDIQYDLDPEDMGRDAMDVVSRAWERLESLMDKYERRCKCSPSDKVVRYHKALDELREMVKDAPPITDDLYREHTDRHGKGRWDKSGRKGKWKS